MKKSTIVFPLLGAAIILAGCTEFRAHDAPIGVTSTPVVAATAGAAEKDLTAFATDEIKARAAELVALHTEKGFPYKELEGPTNGPALLYLSLASKDEKIQLNALKKLSSTYTSNPKSETQALAGPELQEVILKFLNEGNDAQLYHALNATGHSFGTLGNPEVVKKVIEIASSRWFVAMR